MLCRPCLTAHLCGIPVASLWQGAAERQCRGRRTPCTPPHPSRGRPTDGPNTQHRPSGGGGRMAARDTSATGPEHPRSFQMRSANAPANKTNETERRPSAGERRRQCRPDGSLTTASSTTRQCRVTGRLAQARAESCRNAAERGGDALRHPRGRHRGRPNKRREDLWTKLNGTGQKHLVRRGVPEPNQSCRLKACIASHSRATSLCRAPSPDASSRHAGGTRDRRLFHASFVSGGVNTWETTQLNARHCASSENRYQRHDATRRSSIVASWGSPAPHVRVMFFVFSRKTTEISTRRFRFDSERATKIRFQHYTPKRRDLGRAPRLPVLRRSDQKRLSAAKPVSFPDALPVLIERRLPQYVRCNAYR